MTEQGKIEGMKINYLLLFTLIIGSTYTFGQYKYEREHRIRKDQFPPKALEIMDQHLENVKKLKFYKETDSLKNSYEAKFKKDKLWYSMEFNTSGTLEDVEVVIKPVDIPSGVYNNITGHFNNTFEKHRIKKIQRQYPTSDSEELTKTLGNAFQKLLSPSIFYEIEVTGKIDKNYLEYEVLFDAQGNFEKSRERLPPNYDHVLY